MCQGAIRARIESVQQRRDVPLEELISIEVHQVGRCAMVSAVPGHVQTEGIPCSMASNGVGVRHAPGGRAEGAWRERGGGRIRRVTLGRLRERHGLIVANPASVGNTEVSGILYS